MVSCIKLVIIFSTTVIIVECHENLYLSYSNFQFVILVIDNVPLQQSCVLYCPCKAVAN